MAQSLQPKERIPSVGYLRLSSEICTKLSYREAVEIINHFQHRNGHDAIKLRTLADCMGRIGCKISQALGEASGRVLKMYGFDSENGLPMEGVSLTKNITAAHAPQKTADDIQSLRDAIDAVNASHDEKIPFTAEELDIETRASGSVYISIDNVGVKRQKDSRKPEAAKGAKYVENTVVHIQQGMDTYALSAGSMREAMKDTLAFLLFNGLLGNRLVFFMDGAREIKDSIDEMFAFHPHTTVLDWFHLKKKSQELLSMALKGKDVRNEVLRKLLRILWVGDVKGAVSYLEALPPAKIKNQRWLEEQVSYLKRKEYGIACYAVRASLGLRNSSNPVEKENDLLVAQRQKHNGMSWSKHGSNALAAIEMVFQNGYEDEWFFHGQISFEMPKREADTTDLCA